jgi:hypothetical protein
MILTPSASSNRVTAPRPALGSGFGAVELLIVCGVVGVFATYAYPRVNFAQFQVDAGARTVWMTLQNAGRLAVTRQHDVLVSFDLPNNRMRILEDANDNDVVDNGERLTYIAPEGGVRFHAPPAGLSGPASSAVIGSRLQMMDGMPTVIFRRDGAASSDLEVYVESSRELPDDFRAIQVVQSTGRTDWFRYLNDHWKAGSI